MKPTLKFPCSENLDSMPDTAKGKFCKVCSKEVIDFTQMSTTEILNILSQKKTCGIYRSDDVQVQKPMLTIKKKPSRWYSKPISFIVLCLAFISCKTDGNKEKTGNHSANKSCNESKQTAKPNRTLGAPIQSKILIGDTIENHQTMDVVPKKDTMEEVKSVGEVEVKGIEPTVVGLRVPPPIKKVTKDSPSVEVFGVTIEDLASFPGGEEAMIQFLSKNAKHPIGLEKEGTVYVQFFIDTSGKIHNSKVVRGFDKLADAEALRLVNSMPDWIPATIGNKPTTSDFVLPIKFENE